MFDIDLLVALSRVRHAELLADARRRQMIRQAKAASTQRSGKTAIQLRIGSLIDKLLSGAPMHCADQKL